MDDRKKQKKAVHSWKFSPLASGQGGNANSSDFLHIVVLCNVAENPVSSIFYFCVYVSVIYPRTMWLLGHCTHVTNGIIIANVSGISVLSLIFSAISVRNHHSRYSLGHASLTVAMKFFNYLFFKKTKINS